MKKSRLFYITLFLLALLFMQKNTMMAGEAGTNSSSIDSGNNIIGLNSTLIIGRQVSTWVGDPISRWFDRETSVSFGMQYYRKVYPTVLIGPYFEYETMNLGYEGRVLNDVNGGRIGFGMNFVSRIPAVLKDKIGFELGGFCGFGYIWTGLEEQYPEIDSLYGVDFGIFVGPVFELSPKAHFAFHFMGFQGWYFADMPDAASNNNMRIRAQLYLTI